MDSKTRETIFSSKRADYGTPDEIFEPLNEEFDFNLDVCANIDNAKIIPFIPIAVNSLTQDWVGRCWMNPPYGNGVADKWVEKASRESLRPRTMVVGLLPARTDTRWFHNYIYEPMQVRGNDIEIRFIKGRIVFLDPKTGNPMVDPKTGRKMPAPFPSMIVIWR